jgi:chemotaxis protein CheC
MNSKLFSDEQLDYLLEMLNIGAGHASTALNQLLQCEVTMKMPGVEALSPQGVIAALGEPSLPVAGFRMKALGDLTGSMFFIVPDDQKKKLAELAKQAFFGPTKNHPDFDEMMGILSEISNIVVGVFLTAIHDFCCLNVQHSVPVAAVDMVQSILDESLAAYSVESPSIILVKNEFFIGDDRVKAFLLIFPSEGSIKAIVDSMVEAAKKLYGSPQN